ncbi:MAG: hypothetical protein IPF82_16445 [Blastocatellia bacterium]|nr:hypothetical protein [Blastocatellia bacterium]
MAGQLFVSAKTVEGYTLRIYQKLGVRTRREAVTGPGRCTSFRSADHPNTGSLLREALLEVRRSAAMDRLSPGTFARPEGESKAALRACTPISASRRSKGRGFIPMRIFRDIPLSTDTAVRRYCGLVRSTTSPQRGFRRWFTGIRTSRCVLRHL